MSARLKRNSLCLSLLANAEPALARAIIEAGNENLVRRLCECAHDVLTGNVPLKEYCVSIRRTCELWYKGGPVSSVSHVTSCSVGLLACFSRFRSVDSAMVGTGKTIEK